MNSSPRIVSIPAYLKCPGIKKYVKVLITKLYFSGVTDVKDLTTGEYYKVLVSSLVRITPKTTRMVTKYNKRVEKYHSLQNKLCNFDIMNDKFNGGDADVNPWKEI